MPDKKKIPPDDRTRPPVEDEWPHVWSALEKADAGWIIVGPFVAIAKNWKAWLVILAVIVIFNDEKIIEIIKSIPGVKL